MDAKTPEEKKLKEYLQKIHDNLYSCVTSLNLFRAIAATSEEIDTHKFGNSLFAIQRILLNDVILSISKIFEENKDSINIKKIQKYISPNQKNIKLMEPSVEALEKYLLFDFSRLNTFKAKIEATYSKSDGSGNAKQISHFLAFDLESFLKCISDSTDTIYTEHEEDIKALKEIRDKSIAHTDKRPIVKRTTWEQVDKLLLFVKEYIDMMDFVFFTIIHSGDDDESYSLPGGDSMKPSRNLLKLLNEAGVIDRPYKDFDEIIKGQ